MSALLLAQGQSMAEKVHLMWPEVALFAATCIVMVVGLSPSLKTRNLCAPIAAIGLIVAGILAALTPRAPGLLPDLLPFTKSFIAAVALLLLLLSQGVVDRDEEARIAAGRQPFNPLRTNRAEFYSFFLFSITGLMLCATAGDLIWLFLALELTSLPTYIMVAISRTGRDGSKSQEAAVKYFFLGALGAAIFLYGFALIYGGTGSTSFAGIHAAIQGGAGLNGVTTAGLLLAILGIAFKIAAVPMHMYVADVYEGAAAPVSAFLAFVPKTAGFLALIHIVSMVGWNWSGGGVGGGGGAEGLPEELRLTLWVMAALTMTVGNVLAILQSSVKRILAYSSIAHSGYMLVGIIAGPGDGRSFTTNGIAAVLFYLLCYGVMNLGAFAVLACLERRGPDGEHHEIETVDDLRGLCKTHPALGWTMVLCSLSLMGFPPLLGFLGKVPLFTSGIAAGEVVLVVVLGVNSAIAAYYYLRLAWASYLLEPEPQRQRVQVTPYFSRPLAGVISAACVVALIFAAGSLMKRSGEAAKLADQSSAPVVKSQTPAPRSSH